MITVSPRTGRPPKAEKKNVALGLRIGEDTAKKLQKCSDVLKISRTEVIERGIDLVEAGIEKK